MSNGISKKISLLTQRCLRHIQEVHDRRLAAAEHRAAAALARTQSRAAKEIIELRLRQERAKLSRGLYEARIATKRAEAAAENARREAGDLTLREQTTKFIRDFSRAASPYLPRPRKVPKKRRSSSRR
jgi:hypothetical protein